MFNPKLPSDTSLAYHATEQVQHTYVQADRIDNLQVLTWFIAE